MRKFRLERTDLNQLKSRAIKGLFNNSELNYYDIILFLKKKARKNLMTDSPMPMNF